MAKSAKSIDEMTTLIPDALSAAVANCSLVVRNVDDSVKAELSNAVHDCLRNVYKVIVLQCDATIVECLGKPPMYTTIRVNSLRTDKFKIKCQLESHLKKQFLGDMSLCPSVLCHPHIDDLLVVPSRGPFRKSVDAVDVGEVIVDATCGVAVLRGAHVFAVGVLAAPSVMDRGDWVSVYADVESGCRRGLKTKYGGKCVYIGRGIARRSREEIFVGNVKGHGIAVEMLEPLFLAPCLNDVMTDLIFLQNLPSVVCGHILGVQQNDVVLDMCAGPGGKTTHIATLMFDNGLVIAIDKVKSKVKKIQHHAERLSLRSIHSYVFDSGKIVSKVGNKPAPEVPPPYVPESFDRVLLDAPCSGLGQRPQLSNNMTLPELRSFPRLQQKLFRNGVKLLKVGGVLVYSTCTLTLTENEGQVKWATETFPELKLIRQNLRLGGDGLPGSGLDEEHRKLVQRWDPIYNKLLGNAIQYREYDSDTIGFFIAKFLKVEHSRI